MSKIQDLLDQKVQYLKEQEAVLNQTIEKRGKDLNRLSSEIEARKGELENLKLEWELKRTELARELKQIAEYEKTRLKSIEDALIRRSKDVDEKEKGINTLQTALDASMTKFICVLDDHEKNVVIMQNREEKFTIYVKNLSEIVKMIFAIVWEMGIISKSMDEGKTLAQLSQKVYEKIWVSAEQFADLLRFVQQEQEHIKPQREWIAQKTIEISDQWKQIESSRKFISWPQ